MRVFIVVGVAVVVVSVDVVHCVVGCVVGVVAAVVVAVVVDYANRVGVGGVDGVAVSRLGCWSCEWCCC